MDDPSKPDEVDKRTIAFDETELEQQLTKIVKDLDTDISSYHKTVGTLPEKLDQNVTNFLDYEEKVIDRLSEFGQAQSRRKL